MGEREVPRPTPEWDLIRAFLAVVDAGTITAAAERLHSSQPTLSRQLASLEAQLGCRLFERVGRGLRLTSAGEALVGPARSMESAANTFNRTSLGQSQESAGTVRISASEMTSTYVLPQILAPLRREHPEIEIELAVTNRVENLLEHEADIAIRHAQPEQGGLIARHAGAFRVGVFAHRDYLRRVGGKTDFADLQRYDWLGLDRSDLYLRGFREVGVNVGREFFPLRCDDQVTLWQMLLAGMGVGVGTHFVAKQFPQLEPLMTQVAIPPLQVWITAHRELRDSRRIRIVFDALAAGLARVVDAK